MEKIETEKDFLLMRNHDKATVLNTELIPASASKSATGVQLYTLKKNSAISMVCPVKHFLPDHRDYNVTRKIPPPGIFFKKPINFPTKSPI